MDTKYTNGHARLGLIDWTLITYQNSKHCNNRIILFILFIPFTSLCILEYFDDNNYINDKIIIIIMVIKIL